MKEHNLSEQELFIYNIGRDWRRDILNIPFEVLKDFTHEDYDNSKKVWIDFNNMVWFRIYPSYTHGGYIKEALTIETIEKAKNEYFKNGEEIPKSGASWGVYTS